MKADLSGKVAVILGATRGIGRAIALKYAGCGAQVVLQGRDKETADKLITDIEKLGSKGLFVPADLYDYEEVSRVMDAALSRFGRLDIVVASGGTAQPKAKIFHEIEPEDLPRFYESRVYHRVYAIHAAFARMKEAGYGKIICITTDAGRTPTPAESMIGASAASLIFLTRALGREFTQSGVRINTICTTLTADTPPYFNYLQERKHGSDAVIVKAFKKVEEKAPFGLPTADDLAELALYLASPESDRVTGTTISVNSGLSFPG